MMPGGARDDETYPTMKEVCYDNAGNHQIIKATAADSSVVEFTVQIVGWPKPIG